MKSGQIKSFRDQVKETKTFQSWSPIVQKISLSRNSLKPISDAVTIAGNMGLKKWESQTAMKYRSIELVKELLKNKQNG